MATKKKAAPTKKAGKVKLIGGSGDKQSTTDLTGGGKDKGKGSKAAGKKK